MYQRNAATKHFREQLRKRQIGWTEVQDAIDNGVHFAIYGGGGYVCWSRGVLVVASPSYRLITVFRASYDLAQRRARRGRFTYPDAMRQSRRNVSPLSRMS